MSRTLLTAHVFERDDKVYLVTPVAPFTPPENEIEEYAFAEALRKQAPNPNIMWLRGQYVESEKANANGHFWTEGDLGIASVTPTFMPVTVMHDPTTAVGLIADTKLLTREADKVPRSRIDNILGLWRHRFPDICDECQANYEAGELMQSMECFSPHYDCGQCGSTYPRLPGRAEERNWCSHLRGDEGEKAARILRNTTFTGTGLIFGSRGARGAYSDANLDVFQEEVAEAHEKSHRDRKRTPPKPRSRNRMEIEDKRYEELVAAESKVAPLETKVTELQAEADKVPDLEKKLEETETAKTAAETKVTELTGKVEEAEETARKETLAKDRLGKLGKDFLAKLGEFTRGRLEEQAKTLSDEEWDNALKEREEMAGVKRDEGGPGEPDAPAGGGGADFTREDTARAGGGGGGGGNGNGGSGGAPSVERRRSVVAGLARGPKKQTTT